MKEHQTTILWGGVVCPVVDAAFVAAVLDVLLCVGLHSSLDLLVCLQASQQEETNRRISTPTVSPSAKPMMLMNE